MARNQIKILDIFLIAGGPTQGFYLAWPCFNIGVSWHFQTSELHRARDYAEYSLRRFVDTPAGANGFDLPEELLAPCWVKHPTGSADVTGLLDWDRAFLTVRTDFLSLNRCRTFTHRNIV